ncbi:hypothetical protein P1X15_16865 [Runella sp. MFBS21]|uniref:hypothetical protein n=1 Tax=Runella sp. MFBS21 TaxID=3034018 RepID=UPI0023F773F0|nr:hypothetical protein [Runella sp. MFBS21]MDF7819291.1 hypothetical protein [Runella sp. MFBS21]
MEKTAKVGIDGVNLLRELVAYKGESIISNRTIPLEIIEEMAMSYYDIKRSSSNKLYVYVQLVKYFKQRGMFLGDLIRIPEIIYQRIRQN